MEDGEVARVHASVSGGNALTLALSRREREQKPASDQITIGKRHIGDFLHNVGWKFIGCGGRI